MSQHSPHHLPLRPASAASQQLGETPHTSGLPFSNGHHISHPSPYWSHEMLQGLIRGGAGSKSGGPRGWSARQGNPSSPTGLSCASHSPSSSRRVSSLALPTGHLDRHHSPQQVPNLLGFPWAPVKGCRHRPAAVTANNGAASPVF